MAEQTLNLPQIIVVLLLIYLGVRWYYSTPGGASPDSSDPASRSPAAVPRARLVQVERVAQMFPQLGRREILWDLHRNGGNVAATTERILAERGLEVPPPSFRPNLPASTPSNPASRVPSQKPSQPDLITRYNLAAKVKAAEKEAAAVEAFSTSTSAAQASKKEGWSSSRTERQALLQRRREEMILAARRKMLEKDRAKGTEVL